MIEIDFSGTDLGLRLVRDVCYILFICSSCVWGSILSSPGKVAILGIYQQPYKKKGVGSEKIKVAGCTVTRLAIHGDTILSRVSV